MKIKLIESPIADLSHSDALNTAYSQYGALLLRNTQFNLTNFEALTRQFCNDFHEVGTRQAMRQAAGDGFTTQVFRQNFKLLGHCEGAYRPFPPPPDICFFLCITPPSASGGETTLVDGSEMARALPNALRTRLEHEGIIYESLWTSPRWQAEFGVESETELIQLLERFETCRFNLKEGMLHLFYSAPAINSSNDTAIFANGLLAHLPNISHPAFHGIPIYTKPTNKVYFGQGEIFDDVIINTLINAHENVVYRHRWQTGDILIIDNARFLHGREMTNAPCERVLISRFGRKKKP